MSDQQTPRQPAPQHASFFTAHRRFTFIGVGLCVMVAFWIGANLILSTALAPLFPDGMPTWLLLLLSSGPLYTVAMPVSMLVFTRVPALETRRFRLGGVRFLKLLVVCFPVMIIGNLIGTGLSQLISGGQSTNRVADLLLDSDMWVNALFTVLLAPIFEEWMFRKQIIDRARRYGERTAIVLSAFAFALFHMNLYQFFYAFGLGLVFGYAYMRTSRLRYSVILHMIVNANGTLLAPALLSLMGDDAGRAADGSISDAELAGQMVSNPGVLAMFLYGMVMLVLVVAGIVVFCANVRRLEFYAPPEQLPKWYGARLAFLNPGMMAYLVLTVALCIWQMAG